MGGKMIMTVPVKTLDTFDELEMEARVCVFCDELTDTFYCSKCQEYKGLMTILEWEKYTGEVWEE
jgi:hypothetical protein